MLSQPAVEGGVRRRIATIGGMIVAGIDEAGYGPLLGPLVVAALFAVTSMRQGLAVTGALYLLASLVFMLWAPGSRGRQGSSAVPGE